jgi:hypothetical protein
MTFPKTSVRVQRRMQRQAREREFQMLKKNFHLRVSQSLLGWGRKLATGTQLGAASAGVFIYLRLARHDRAARQNLYRTTRPAGTDGRARRARALSGQAAQGLFDNPIFERMKTYRGEAPVRL